MKCPFCNHSIPEDAVFCAFCGNRLADKAPGSETYEPASEPDTDPDSEPASGDIGSSGSAVLTEAPDVDVSAEIPMGDVSAEAPEVDVSAEIPVGDVSSEVSEVDVSPEAPGSAEAPRRSSANVLPEMPDSARNASKVDLGKNKRPKSKNRSENKANVFRNIASAVRSDGQQAAQAVKSRSFKELLENKTVIIALAAIIAIILIVIIACCAAAGGSELKIRGAYHFTKDGGDGVFLYNGAVVKGADFSAGCTTLATSIDGTAALVGDGEELYMLANGKASLITDEFDSGRASVSANGKTAAYVSDGAVYVWIGGRSRKITDIEDESFCLPVISPDGKVVAFSDLDDDDIDTYAWKGNRVIDLDADIIPFSVSNGGKMLYGADRSGELCYIRNLRKDSDEKIDAITSIAGISLDHTRLLYVSEGSTYCFDPALDGEEGVRIARDIVAPISEFSYRGTPYIVNFKRFYGKEGGDLYEYYRKGGDYDDDKLVSDANGLILSKDGKSFVYIDDGDVMRGALSNAKNAKKAGKDAVSAKGNADFHSVFYLDDDNDLRYAGKDGKIASDVKLYVVTDGGICVFSDDDNDLWYSVKGGSKKKAGLDEIRSLIIENNVVYAVSDGELYTSTNGRSFKKTGVEAG